MATKKPATPLETLLAELRTLATQIAAAEVDSDPRAAKRARHALEEVTGQLATVAASLDPVIRPDAIFDPTDIRSPIGLTNLGNFKCRFNNNNFEIMQPI